MNQKLLLLDIDGTLTEPGYNIPPDSALDAIRKAQAKGHKVFLCTGRNLAMLRPLLTYGFDGYVASAGGYVVCDGKVVFDRPMKPEVFSLAKQIAASQTSFTPFIIAGVFYFVANYAVAFVMERIEKALDYYK